MFCTRQYLRHDTMTLKGAEKLAPQCTNHPLVSPYQRRTLSLYIIFLRSLATGGTKRRPYQSCSSIFLPISMWKYPMHPSVRNTHTCGEQFQDKSPRHHGNHTISDFAENWCIWLYSALISIFELLNTSLYGITR